ncbi:hypothetical protein PRZ48_003102 [Zasmidium cellare]|uniref:F-box domain-containing protein n=1 Tax=Zasmidium cellare TaxID=395010 RepID=A0ABR0EUQ3_ZASCE|nr:hypothetical protein PRZ48_003102 [Zasmidium cellare]
MAPPLESLPDELLLHIVGYISRISDLKALCLTSKDLQGPATTQLYRRVCLTGVTTGSPELNALLTKTHPGFKQIRSFYCSPKDRLDPLPEELKAMVEVLKALPKHSLRTFICPDMPVNEEVIMTILPQQQKLKKLALGPLTSNLMPFINAGVLDLSAFAKLQTLQIPAEIGSEHDLELYQLIIESAKLNDLAIACFETQRGVSEDLDDQPDSDGLISRTLFKHIRNTDPPKRIALANLQLAEVGLGWSDRTFSCYFEWSALKGLDLVRCPEAGVLITAVTKHLQAHGAQLKNFRCSPFQDELIDSNVISAFLGSFDGLRGLSLAGVSNFSSIDLQAFAKHTDTLEYLALHPDGRGNKSSTEMGMDAKFFSAVFAKCRKLRQVATPLPAIDLPRSSEDPVNLQDYDTALLTLLELPDLKSLRVYNWPKSQDPFIHGDYTDDPEDVLNTNTNAYLQAHGDFVIDHFSKLYEQKKCVCPWPILAFNGLQDSTIADGQMELPLYKWSTYVPVKRISVFGQIKVALEYTPFSDIRYFEPESEILDA